MKLITVVAICLLCATGGYCEDNWSISAIAFPMYLGPTLHLTNYGDIQIDGVSVFDMDREEVRRKIKIIVESQFQKFDESRESK